ncbi:MAG: glutathione S-transferase [Verrucomicrobiales bacterium]|jgi:glutathione S-transferase|nr:glutathione S-transferase [Verrucomicrobiales bacterium]
MIELIQVPWSPYCIVQRRILEYSRAKFKIINIPNGDRSLVWKLSRQRFYQVPLLKDGKSVVFETGDNSQVISKYLDSKLGLGLFPAEWEGVQSLIWRYFENDIEGVGFKLNDIYCEEMVPVSDRLGFVRHKERKFGRGCIEQWRKQQNELLAQFDDLLLPCEEMLFNKPFLLGHNPLFLDFNLFGMLGNFLYSGHYKIPARHTSLIEWYGRMRKVKFSA